jgi:hypothetical protein
MRSSGIHSATAMKEREVSCFASQRLQTNHYFEGAVTGSVCRRHEVFAGELKSRHEMTAFFRNASERFARSDYVW